MCVCKCVSVYIYIYIYVRKIYHMLNFLGSYLNLDTALCFYFDLECSSIIIYGLKIILNCNSANMSLGHLCTQFHSIDFP